jgi:hypothetical protein
MICGNQEVSMTRISGTRALKNAKYIRSVAPHLFPENEPLDGYASVIPFELLSRFHRMTDEELRPHPHLLDAARKARQEFGTFGSGYARGGDEARLFGAAPFRGTVHFVKITFMVGSNPVALGDADMLPALQYAMLALPQISKYASQYGDNALKLSSDILQLTVDVPSGKYNDDMLRNWVRGLVDWLLVSGVEKHPKDVCIVVLNPPGVTNTDGDLAQGIGGYHDAVLVPWIDLHQLQSSPYCFVNVSRAALTIEDRADAYAQTLSHEIAEMAVDPPASWPNPEVCDACAGNCGPEWRSFFEVASLDGFSRYLRTATTIPPLPFNFSFFVAAVAHPQSVDNCPAGMQGCDYGPDDRVGLSELLFYERLDGYGETYSVDGSSRLSLQTTHPGMRTTWSQIVAENFTAKSAGDPQDVLFYDSTAGVGEVYQTGNLGQMNRIAINSGWRPSWSIIVPGHFSDSPNIDLLFYDPTDGTGEFYHTDGHGNLAASFASYTNFRTTWSIIIAGHFSNRNYDDLMFYDSTAGVAEFYPTGGGLRSRFADYTNLRTTWSIIIAGNFSDSEYDDLLFYDSSAGVGEFYPTGDGIGPRFADYTGFRTTWSTIIPGKFSNSQYDDLLFYDPAAGVGEFYPTGGGLGPLIAGYTDWRTTWSIIKRL